MNLMSCLHCCRVLAVDIANSWRQEISSQRAALHNPDMVAGGYNLSKTTAMGVRNVNSAIGPSWNGSGRLKAMDA